VVPLLHEFRCSLELTPPTARDAEPRWFPATSWIQHNGSERQRKGVEELDCGGRMSLAEIAANAFNAASIFLAGRNSLHVWWTTIVGCLLFGYVFYHAQLYADVTLQAFFIVASIVGWWRWLHGYRGAALPVRHSSPSLLLVSIGCAVAVAAGYGWLLHRYTNAFAPFVDSIVLAFSVVGQLLMIDRRVENWWFWLLAAARTTSVRASCVLKSACFPRAVRWPRVRLASRQSMPARR
jgi:nicotinamide mononucleotide transporter